MASLSASSSVDANRFKFKVAHFMQVQDVASLLVLKRVLKSPPLTCPDDPEATSFNVEIGFGRRKDNFLSIHFFSSNANVRFGIIKYIIYDDNGNRIGANAHSGDVSGKSMGWANCLSLENAGSINWTIHYEQYYEPGLSTETENKAGLSEFSADILSLLDDPEDSDFKFIVKNNGRVQEIPAHKILLVARSDYFRALFKSGMKESLAKEIKIEEDPALVKELLKYIYSGLPPKNLDKIAIGLVPLADKYQLNGLKESCISSLYRTVSKKNVIDILLLAEDLHLPGLLRYCVPIFQVWAEFLKSTAHWSKLRQYPELLLKLLQLCNE